jgi:putative membrane protein
MINFIKSGIIAASLLASISNPEYLKENNSKSEFNGTLPQTSDAALLNQLNELCTKQLRAAGLAGKQGGTEVKNWGNRLSIILSQFNDEIRVLAKNKSIALSSSMPEGGQRPDGRTDSSPENLRDTSRINSGAGEAGNSGLTKTKAIGINDQASNALVASLKKLKGNAFDRSYKNLLLSDRPTAENLLYNASQSTDASISAFGKKHLAKLKAAKL